jgi:hypothetical protein
MTKLCATAALVCALASAGGAAADTVRPAGKSAVERAEAAARKAVAPLVVENAVCIQRSRKRVLCLLRHPAASGRQCRSAVLVRGRRVRVIQSNHCFEIREVTP